MDTLKLPARLDLLEAFLGFVLKMARQAGAQPELLADIRLGLEEILTNIFFYAYPSQSGEVELVATPMDRELNIRITDWGVPFDPTKYETPDLQQEFSERAVGGMGIYLARSVIHEMVYERTPDANHLTVRFQLR